MPLHGHVLSVRYCTVITHARVSVQVFIRVGCQSQFQCVVFSSGLVSHLDQEVGTNKVQHSAVKGHGVIWIWAH